MHCLQEMDLHPKLHSTTWFVIQCSNLQTPKDCQYFIVSYQCHVFLCLIMLESWNWTTNKPIKSTYIYKIPKAAKLLQTNQAKKLMTAQKDFLNPTEGQTLYQYGKKKELNQRIMYHLFKRNLIKHKAGNPFQNPPTVPFFFSSF